MASSFVHRLTARLQLLLAGLGFGFTTTFPLPVPIHDTLQFPAVNVIWLCSADLEVAEPAESRPRQLAA